MHEKGCIKSQWPSIDALWIATLLFYRTDRLCFQKDMIVIYNEVEYDDHDADGVGPN